MNRCTLCGKTISDDNARFGPDCQARYDEALTIIETSNTEIAELLISGDATVQRFLLVLSRAIIGALKTSGAAKMQHLKCAREFISGARRAAVRMISDGERRAA